MLRFFWKNKNPDHSLVQNEKQSSEQESYRDDSQALPDDESSHNSDSNFHSISQEDGASEDDVLEDDVLSMAENIGEHTESLPDDGIAISNDVPLIKAMLNHSEGKPATLILHIPLGACKNVQIMHEQWGCLVFQKSEPSRADTDTQTPDRSIPSTDPLAISTFSNLSQSSVDHTIFTPIFCGKVFNIIEKQGMLEIHLIADQFCFAEHWAVTATSIQAMGCTHEIWNSQDPDTLLACVPYALYWDRWTGKMSISHACTGKKTWDLSQLYDPKYRVVRKNKPISRIDVEISAQWVQRILGYSNVAPEIASRFPNGIIATLTDRALESSWPETGRIFPSGYFVSESHLTKIRNAQHPEAIVLSTSDPVNGLKTRDWIAQCSFYQGHLILGYFYQQKRREILRYGLKAALPKEEEGRVESVSLPLPPFIRNDDLPLWDPLGMYSVGDKIQHEGRVYVYKGQEDTSLEHQRLRRAYDAAVDSPPCWEEIPEESKWLLPAVSDTFFQETLGQEIFKHSLNHAKTALIWGARCIHRQVRGTLEDFHAITLNDAIVLQDHVDEEILSNNDQNVQDDNATPPIEKKNTGKVIDYTLHFDGIQGTAYVQITGAFSIPLHASNLLEHPPQTEVLQDHELGNVEDIAYAWPKKDPPRNSIAKELENGICKNIHVTNPLDEQLQCLHNIQKKLDQDDWDPTSVQSKETRIRINFHSLRTQECLEHCIDVPVLSPYANSAAPEKEHTV